MNPLPEDGPKPEADANGQQVNRESRQRASQRGGTARGGRREDDWRAAGKTGLVARGGTRRVTGGQGSEVRRKGRPRSAATENPDKPTNRRSTGETARNQQSGTAASPVLPEDVSASELDREIRTELRPLTKTVADTVARRLVVAGELLDQAPTEALAHASAARRLAPRISAVREAVGLAAYRAGEWKLAISELRAYQRISGRQTHLAVIADCERALGRPERAIDMYRSVDPEQYSREDFTELLIVAAGARRDLGQIEAAAAMLQVPALREGPQEPWVARLRHAYAEVLIELGDGGRAREWLHRAVDADLHAETGAAERLLELEGVLLIEAEAEPGSPGE